MEGGENADRMSDVREALFFQLKKRKRKKNAFLRSNVVAVVLFCVLLFWMTLTFKRIVDTIHTGQGFWNSTLDEGLTKLTPAG